MWQQIKDIPENDNLVFYRQINETLYSIVICKNKRLKPRFAEVEWDKDKKHLYYLSAGAYRHLEPEEVSFVMENLEAYLMEDLL